MKRWLAGCVGAAAAAHVWAAEDVRVRPNPTSPGDLLVVEVTRAPKYASLAANPLRFFKWPGRYARRALVGIDVEAAPGEQDLVVRWTHAPRVVRRVQIRAKKFPREALTVAPEFVEPPGDVMDRVRAEQQRLDQLWRRVSGSRYWKGPFQRPIDTPLLSAFGLQRVFNGKPRSPHPGVDFRGELGAPVKAANAGKVALAEELYFTGKTVVVDHGLGLYTVYAHLSDIAVKPKQRVIKGAVVGAVGATGRATGPHLHWGARLMQARVDALQLLDLEAEKKRPEQGASR